MTRGAGTHTAAVVGGLRGMHRLRRCLGGVGDLPAFVLRHDVRSGRIDWWELLRDDRRLRPYDFEFHFSVAGRRDAYHAQNLAHLRATGRRQIARLLGFWDLYVPLVVEPEFTLVFYCGQWAKEVPTRDTIVGVWHELSGHAPALDDAMFRQWARCCLRVPVLSSRLQAGLLALGRLLGGLFSVDAVPSQRRIDRLRARVFAPVIHDDSWVDSCLDVTGLTRPPWGLDEFMDERIVEETGLRHRPSQLVILAPSLPPERGPDQLDIWIRQRQFQHHAVLVAREIPDAIAGALGDHAVVVALAAPPSLRGRARHTYFDSQCRRLQQLLAERMGLASIAALGVEVNPGQGLGACFRHAAAALERAVRERRSFVRATAKTMTEETFSSDPQRIGARLKRAFELGRLDEVRVEMLHYTREVLAATGARPQVMVVHFLVLLRDLLASLEARGVLQAARGRRLHAQALDELASITEPQWLTAEFERIVTGVSALAATRAADGIARLRAAVEWVRQNLRARDALVACAKRAGLATSSFRRTFRRQQGVSFAAWLRRERLESARRTLVLSGLSVSDVARDAGFPNVHTFIRCFRARFGRTPGVFRREGRLDGVA